MHMSHARERMAGEGGRGVRRKARSSWAHRAESTLLLLLAKKIMLCCWAVCALNVVVDVLVQGIRCQQCKSRLLAFLCIRSDTEPSSD
jgi:hypothetical protein